MEFRCWESYGQFNKYVMRNWIDIVEARRNPEVNNKRKGLSNIEELIAYAAPNTFVSFTKLPKLGINPRSMHSTTPLGVYAYPLYEKTIQDEIQDNALPFAGDAPYMNVIRSKATLIDLQNINAKEMMEKVDKWITEKTGDRALASDIRFFLNNKNLRDGAKWWRYTSMAVLATVHNFRRSAAEIPYYFNKYPDPHKWTKMMLDIGVNGVVDHGSGTIHFHELSQAVFFNPQAITVIDRLHNPFSQDVTIQITDARKLYNALPRDMNVETAIHQFAGRIIRGYPGGEIIAAYWDEQRYCAINLYIRVPEDKKPFLRSIANRLRNSTEYNQTASFTFMRDMIDDSYSSSRGLVVYFFATLLGEEIVKAYLESKNYAPEQIEELLK